ncbi:hypothetical protein [Fusobacterium sp.]|uniref:hypothetical protein n=1 Tax=Fusobacterium sp. TaxID=68766 RepID=UPI0026341FD0|nr:hypothetical protein [Fusobacterium sp.]
MKKIILLVILIMCIPSFAKEKLAVIDEVYVLENYQKTKDYNEVLKKLREGIEKKYSIDFNDDSEELKSNKGYIEFQKKREELSREVNFEVEWAMYLVCEKDMLVEKKMVRFGRVDDISKRVLKFLNDEYSRENMIIKSAKKTDIMGVIA